LKVLGSEVLRSIFGALRRQEEGAEYMSFMLCKITLNKGKVMVKVIEARRVKLMKHVTHIVGNTNAYKLSMGISEWKGPLRKRIR
jgi:hypothetical protein